MRVLGCLILTVILAPLSGCQPDKDKSSAVPEQVEHSEPLAHLTGAKMKATITVDEVKSLERWWIHRRLQILRHSTAAELQKQTSYNDPLSRRVETYKVGQLTIQAEKDDLLLNDPISGLTLRFVVAEGLAQLKEVNQEAVELLHLSRHEVSGEVSLMWREKKTDNLTSLILSENQPASVNTAAKPEGKYLYLFPPQGRWRTAKVNLTLCGVPTAASRRVVAAIADWQKVLAGRLEIVVRELKQEYPPFSDLNVHCIYWIEGFRISKNEKKMHAGGTQNLVTVDGRGFLDNDIYLYASELMKIKDNNPNRQDQMRLKAVYDVTLHEVGHWLGLDHQPDQKIPSVMGESGVDKLTDYDIEAIQQLYPPLKPIRQ